MKKIFFPALVSLFLLVPVQVTAQTPGSSVFDTTDFPQWAKDARRWDIIAFGSFPFTMFATTFFMDTYRWNKYSNFNDTRYAPWPMKSAGAIEMTKDEYEKTMIIAASLSAAIAFTDLIIVKIKQNKERRRIESIPEGSAIIIRTPYPDSRFGEPEEDSGYSEYSEALQTEHSEPE